MAAAAIASRSSRSAASTLISVDRMPEFPRELRAVLERRRGGHEAAGRRREGADRALQNLLRAGAEDDVLGLGAELRRDGGDEGAVGGRAVERVTPGLGELAHDRVERRLARAEGVLVAADADGLDAGRQRRPGWYRAALCRPGFPRARARQSRAPCHNPRLNALRPGRRKNCGAIGACDPPPSRYAVVTARILRAGPGGVKPARPTSCTARRSSPGFRYNLPAKSACTSPALLTNPRKR